MKKTGPAVILLFLAAAAFLLPELAALAADAAKEAVATPPPFSLTKFLGPFHSVVLHYPIGFVTLAVVLEIYSLKSPSPQLRQIITLVIGLAALSAVVAATFGILRAEEGGYDGGTVTIHRWTGVAVTAFTIIGWLLHRSIVRNPTRTGLLKTYRGLIAGNFLLLVVAGHEGGNLTHGANYLFEGAPTFVKKVIVEMEEVVSTPKVEVPVEESKKIFVAKIRPILEAKCIKCHGPDKMKGSFRLDVGEIAFKGGESGKPAIKPNDAFQSNLIRLVLLPKDHDDVMPPTGKEPLTTEEVVTLINWIQEGAPFADFGVAPKTEKTEPDPNKPAPTPPGEPAPKSPPPALTPTAAPK